jgi:hypothetical protein
VGAKERTECNKELRIVTVVEIVYEFSQNWEFRQNGNDFWGGNELQGYRI